MAPRQMKQALRWLMPRLRLKPKFSRQRAAKVIVTILLVLFAFLFVTPLRNVVAVYIVPKTMLEVSSAQILKMYINEQRFPDYDKPVTCDAVKDKLATVDWAGMAANVDKIGPTYDGVYFEQLLKDKESIGTTEDDLLELKLKHPTFLSPMTKRQQLELRLVFQAFYTAMELFGITYFLMEGSMLGAYRHHGFIPWDDDMDLVANGADWFKIKQILHCLPGFDVDTSSYMMYKFYWTKSESETNINSVRFPSMDIFLYTEDEEYMWALSGIKKHRILFKKTDIFPLTLRPFNGKLVPVPRKFEDLVNAMYNANICLSRDYDHFRNRPLVPFVEYEYVPCDLFKKLYPFVERINSTVNGETRRIEVLKVGKKVLNNFTVPVTDL